MTCKLIVAVDRGNAIGYSDGRLPWKIKADMKRFKDLTTGSTVVMGRKTFMSIGLKDGLPNRRNVVLTRQPWAEIRDLFGEVEIISSFTWIQAHQQCLGCDAPDLWIIGGAEIYKEALERNIVDEIYLTLVGADTDADVHFPVDLYAWKLFIIRERAKGIFWEVLDIQNPTVAADSPGISFMTLKKQK